MNLGFFGACTEYTTQEKLIVLVYKINLQIYNTCNHCLNKRKFQSFPSFLDWAVTDKLKNYKLTCSHKLTSY